MSTILSTQPYPTLPGDPLQGRPFVIPDKKI
jgi:hypothetical protein